MTRIPQLPASNADQIDGRIAHLTETNINQIFGREGPRTETTGPTAAIIDDPIAAGGAADIITRPISPDISAIPDRPAIPDRRDIAGIDARIDIDDRLIEPTTPILIRPPAISAAARTIMTIWRRAIFAIFGRGQTIRPAG